MNIKERIASKLTSGRYLITVLLTIGFLIMVGKGLISGAEFTQIFSTIVTFYFVRDKLSSSKNNSDTEGK